MTTIGMTEHSAAAVATPAWSRSVARRVLLACGILSSLLYAATDILGGMRYPGYSFTSRAVSELMAIGAPSESFVDPLFLAYGALALAFGIGVLREGAERRRSLRIAGALLIIYAAAGFTGPTLFEMHRQVPGHSVSDLPHIILTSVLVLLTLLAMGFGAFSLGKVFRVYTFGTLATVILFGALSAPFGARLAAGEPTPGFGIIERVNIYASLLWLSMLAVALLRRPVSRFLGELATAAATRIHGMVAPGFEEVRREFERNFAERGEIGAAVTAYWRGEKVVDLWGGYRAPDSDLAWDEDTMIVITKRGLSCSTSG